MENEKQICFLRLNQEEYDYLKLLADRKDVSVSTYVTEVVRNFLDENKSMAKDSWNPVLIGEWIDAKNHIPELKEKYIDMDIIDKESDRVLVKSANGIYIGTLTEWTFTATGRKEYIWMDNVKGIKDVIAWTPLPE